MGGRGASFGAGRTASNIDSAKDFDSLKDYAKEKMGIEIDDRARDLDIRAIKELLHGIEDVERDFPEVASSVNEIVVRAPGEKAGLHGALTQTTFAGADPALPRIYINSAHFKDADSLNRELDKASKSGHSFAAGIRGVAHHEMGHKVEWMLQDRRWRADSALRGKRNYSESANQVQTIAKSKGNATGKSERKAKVIKRAWDLLDKHSSDYGRGSAREAFSEAFADHYGSRGRSTNPLTKGIMQETRARWNKAVKGGGKK